MNSEYPQILQFGPYEGENIEDIVETDPAYVLEISITNPEMSISPAILNRARQRLDQSEPWLDDDDFEEEQLFTFGSSRFDYE